MISIRLPLWVKVRKDSSSQALDALNKDVDPNEENGNRSGNASECVELHLDWRGKRTDVVSSTYCDATLTIYDLHNIHWRRSRRSIDTRQYVLIPSCEAYWISQYGIPGDIAHGVALASAVGPNSRHISRIQHGIGGSMCEDIASSTRIDTVSREYVDGTTR